MLKEVQRSSEKLFKGALKSCDDSKTWWTWPSELDDDVGEIGLLSLMLMLEDVGLHTLMTKLEVIGIL